MLVCVASFQKVLFFSFLVLGTERRIALPQSYIPSPCYFLFWDRVSLNWLQICNLPASISWVAGLQVCTTVPGQRRYLTGGLKVGEPLIGSPGEKYCRKDLQELKHRRLYIRAGQFKMAEVHNVSRENEKGVARWRNLKNPHFTLITESEKSNQKYR